MKGWCERLPIWAHVVLMAAFLVGLLLVWGLLVDPRTTRPGAWVLPATAVFWLIAIAAGYAVGRWRPSRRGPSARVTLVSIWCCVTVGVVLTPTVAGFVIRASVAEPAWTELTGGSGGRVVAWLDEVSVFGLAMVPLYLGLLPAYVQRYRALRREEPAAAPAASG